MSIIVHAACVADGWSVWMARHAIKPFGKMVQRWIDDFSQNQINSRRSGMPNQRLPHAVKKLAERPDGNFNRTFYDSDLDCSQMCQLPGTLSLQA